MKKIQIIYILSCGHSGSTLLNLILGSSPNSYSLGEFMFLKNRLQQTNYIGKKIDGEKLFCTCGKELHECRFWSPITKSINLSKLYSPTPKKVDYIHLFLYLYFGFYKSIYKEKNNDSLLFKKTLEEAQKIKSKKVSFLIDSSKSLKRVLHLQSNSQFDVKVLHLTRDGRGVMNSYKKLNFSLISSYGYWIINNILIRRYVKSLRKKHPHNVLSISYDLFTQHPKKYLERINSQFGTQVDLKHYLTQTNKETFHNFGGNGLRNKKITEIRYDQSWKKKFSWPLRQFSTILCFIPNTLWVKKDDIKK